MSDASLRNALTLLERAEEKAKAKEKAVDDLAELCFTVMTVSGKKVYPTSAAKAKDSAGEEIKSEKMVRE